MIYMYYTEMLTVDKTTEPGGQLAKHYSNTVIASINIISLANVVSQDETP